MRKTLAFMALAAVAAFSAPAAAQSRCQDMLADWQRRVPERIKERGVNEQVERANAALQRGDERACRQHMPNAFELVGGSGSSARDERYGDRRYDDRRADDRYDRRYEDRRYDDRADRRYDDRRYDDRYDDRRRTEGSGGGLGELIERGLGTLGR